VSRVQRRDFLIATGAILAAPFAVAQQAAKIARIGYLAPNVVTVNSRLFEAFRQGLRDLGYVEARNLLIEVRSAEGKSERLPVLAAELVGLKVDVIVSAGGTLAALAARQATRTVPIVVVSVGDPVTSGLVSSLARPGGNVTGLSLPLPGCWQCLQIAGRSGNQSSAVLSRPGAKERKERTSGRSTSSCQGAGAASRR
jgi:putative ABC transport system substrate-binding protein